MHKTVRLGIDVGKARIGVARTDIDGTMAVPVETVNRDENSTKKICAVIEEYNADIVYVGFPLSLSGEQTASTADAIAFAHELSKSTTAHIRLIDERLSTVSATSSLQAAGHNAKSAKGIIDQAAAVVILEHALSIEKTSQNWAGRALDE